MEKKLSYNSIYLIIALLNDLSAVKLPTKAMTEKLLIRAHYNKPFNEFEEFKQTTNADEAADEEAKAKAVDAKLVEEVEGFTPRYFSETALEQIVGAVMDAAGEGGCIKSRLAAYRNDKDEVVFGDYPAELWLQNFIEMLVEG